MPESQTPVAVPLARKPLGMLKSLAAARNNVLSIILSFQAQPACAGTC